jgi:hypothetical protein
MAETLSTSDSIEQAIHNLHMTFGGCWPPKSQFTSWPKCFDIYMNICDKIPNVIARLDDPKLFREWMETELDQVSGL